jgi:tetratricopeptide (TPR) repeat protein
MGARRVFTAARAALVEEGMAPGPKLRNLNARAEHGVPPSSLPSRSLVFTGRDAELAAIAAADRMAWLSGAPGVGKTGLAVEAAYRLRDRYPDGQLLVELNGYTPGVAATTVGDALATLLAELGVPPEQIPATEGRKSTLYQTTLYGTRTLVVLDNAASAEQVRSLLPEDEGCFAIVTSRRMGDAGEAVRLSPLPPEEAAALFRRMTDTPRTRGRSAEVAEVVARCGFLPVQIQVAAGLLRRHEQWSLAHLLGLLADGGLLDDGNAAVRVSYQQLDEARRGLFRLLGHLPGPDVDVRGAAALAGCDVPTARMLLDELHEVSLLEEVGTERYRLLDPLKEFAAAEAPATPTEQADALLRLFDYYLVTLTTAVVVGFPFDRTVLPTADRTCAVAPDFAEEALARQWIAVERNNLVAAVHYAATHDLPEHTWRLAVLMWRYFNHVGQIEDWLATVERAWKIVAADETNEYGQAHVLLRLSIANDRLGKLADAMELAAKALPKWVRLGDLGGEAATLCALAIPTMELGRNDDAIANLGAALTRYEQIDDLRGQAHALAILGYLNEQLGNLDVALHQHRSAANISREIGDTRGLAHILTNLGSVQQKLGHLTEALASYTDAYEHAVEAGDRAAEAYALNDIGNVHRLNGDLAEAARFQDRARTAATGVGDADLRFRLYLDRGATAEARGDLAEAFRACQAALDQAVGTDNRGHQAAAHHAVARVLHAFGRHEEAAPHWATAETEYAALDYPEVVEVRAGRAALTCECG